MVRHNLMDMDYCAKIGLAIDYALEGCPGLSSGAILFASEGSWEDIKDKDFVAYRVRSSGCDSCRGHQFNQKQYHLAQYLPGHPG